MLRVVEYLRGAARLHDAARVHHRHLVGHFRHHAQVVGDHDLRRPRLLPEVAHQVEDLRLYGDVERRGRLVRDQQRGVVGQRHGDHHPLAHPARQLVRIFVQPLFRCRDAHPAQHLERPRAAFLARGVAVFADHLRDLVADPQGGVERCHRLLKDHRDPVSAQLPQGSRIRREQVFSLKDRRAAFDPERCAREQTHQRQRRQAFAAAGFADDAKRLPGIERKAQILDQRTRRPRDADREAADFEKGGRGAHPLSFSSELFRLSKSMLRCSRIACAAAAPSRASMASMMRACCAS